MCILQAISMGDKSYAEVCSSFAFPFSVSMPFNYVAVLVVSLFGRSL